jgi:FAD:protein FMN transferase
MSEQRSPNLRRFSRRRFIRIVAAAGIGSVGLCLLGRVDDPRPPEVSVTRTLMGTIINVILIGEERGKLMAALEAAFGRMAELEGVMSRFLPGSSLSRLNKEGRLPNPSPELLNVLQQAQQVSELTGGAFDITVKPLFDLYFSRPQADNRQLPGDAEIQSAREKVGYHFVHLTDHEIFLERPGMSLTLDGIAKGYIVDAGVFVLRSLGFNEVLVEAGGDLMGSGGKSDTRPWEVGIQSPRRSRPGTIATVEIRDRAVATSGDYMQALDPEFQHHHIIDPRSGLSPAELSSVSVLAPGACQADALATGLMVLGVDKGLALLGRLPGVEALFITKDMKLAATPHLALALGAARP